MIRKSWFGNGASVAALWLLGGCAGLPVDVTDSATSAVQRIAAETERTDNLEAQFRDFRDSDGFADFERYAERERWDGEFAEARAKVASADGIYKNEVQPLLDEDSPDDADKARLALQKIPPLLDGARESAQTWSVRRDFLAKVAADPGGTLAICEGALQAIEESAQDRKARVAEAKRNHAGRAEDIDRLANPLEELADSAVTARAAAAAERRKFQSGAGDLAILGDSCERARMASETLGKAVPELLARLAELDRSYSRVLMDMKTEYALLIRRQSWDDYYDYPALHDADYRLPKVDGPTFEHFANVPGSLATLSRSGFFGDRLRLLAGVDRARWEALNINPVQQWPRGDTAAEFWLEQADARYFHKYFLEESGETRETDWVEVEEAFFLANVENLGMDVESKPYGAFDSEKLTQPAPPGMGYVGNPRYGRWTSDGSGGMVWSWLGPYLFYRTMFGGPVLYGRGEWETWHGGYRGSRPYYGGTAAAPRWGSRSQTVQTSPRMRGSTFARTGGLRSAPSSVRGAGPRSRGGSFGASGK